MKKILLALILSISVLFTGCEFSNPYEELKQLPYDTNNYSLTKNEQLTNIINYMTSQCSEIDGVLHQSVSLETAIDSTKANIEKIKKNKEILRQQVPHKDSELEHQVTLERIDELLTTLEALITAYETQDVETIISISVSLPMQIISLKGEFVTPK